MNKVKIFILLILSISINLFANPVTPEGDGTVDSPYLIANYENLEWISANTDSWDKYFMQTSDIDFAEAITTSFEPIGGINNISFSGTYDGNGHSIKNVSVVDNTEVYMAFFSETENATIKNLSLINIGAIGIGGVASLIGIAYTSNIENCNSSGVVTATSYGDVGGLIAIDNGSTITNCYTTVEVNAQQNVCGGLIGSIDGSTITNCYSTGAISTSGIEDIGGLIGIGYYSTITNCYWDTETSGQTTSEGGEGRTTAEMQDITTYINWDFEGETANGNDDYWKINSYDNGGYPFFTWERYGLEPIGLGSQESPYQISSLRNLLWINIHNFSWDKYYEQTVDIDASETSTWNLGEGFLPIGNYDIEFTGSYNGNNYSITGLFINRPESSSPVGFFGKISDGTIKNLALLNINIIGKNSTGGLVGSNWSNMLNCHTTGSVFGNFAVGGLLGENDGYTVVENCYNLSSVSGLGVHKAYIGGLIGYNGSYSEVKNCYNTGNVEGISEIGGLMGICENDIINCYNVGNVTGTQQTGGLIGNTQSAEIHNCYSAGLVVGDGEQVGGLIGLKYETSNVLDCFWDIEISNQVESEGGTGKTTSEMKDISTYTDASWDFMNETTNGTNGYWGINDSENNGYPYLNFDLGTGINNTEIYNTAKLRNYPNPFNSGCTIDYSIEESTNVLITVYNSTGKMISTLVNENQNAGHYSFNWNIGNNPEGMYFIRMHAGNSNKTVKTVFVK